MQLASANTVPNMAIRYVSILPFQRFAVQHFAVWHFIFPRFNVWPFRFDFHCFDIGPFFFELEKHTQRLDQVKGRGCLS